MKLVSAVALFIALSTLLLGGLVFAWWGWHSLDSSLLLFGSRLC